MLNHSGFGRQKVYEFPNLLIQRIFTIFAVLSVFLVLGPAAYPQRPLLSEGTIAVDAFNNLAATADLSGAVTLFDATSPGAPKRLSAVTVPRRLSGVALAGQYLLVSGQGGVQILDISNPKSPIFAKTVTLDSDATVVRAAGNLGYTASGSTVVLFDISTGEILDRHEYSGFPVNDLALCGDYFYVVSADSESSAGFRLDKVPVQGFLGQPIASWTSTSERTGRGRMSLSVGDNLIYIGSVLAEGDGQVPGLEVIEDLGASFRVKGVPLAIDARMVRPTGVGLLAYTGASGQAEDTSQLGVLDIVDPSNTAKVLRIAPTKGSVEAIELYNGYAYLAAGRAGLEPILFATPNGSRVLPAVTLDAGVVSEAPVEGNLVRLSAKVTASDQLRKVDFYVNGQKVASDGGYPFEYRYYAADADLATPPMVSACAEDLNGNRSCSKPQQLASKPKGGLKVTAVTPAEGGHSPRSTKLAISAQFSLPLDAKTVVLKNVSLVQVSKTASPSTTVALATVTYQAATKSIVFQPKSALAKGTYKAVLSSGIKSTSGASLVADYSWVFQVDPVTETWTSQTSGDWAVAANWSLGAVPANGDSVVISVPGVAVSMGTTSGSPVLANLNVGATSTLNITGGNLSIEGSGAGTVSGTLNLSSGSLGGPGTTTVSKAMNWTGGSITGVVTIPAGAVMNMVTPNGVPSQFNLNGGVINNSGTVNHSWVGVGYGLYIYNGASINNLAGGIWNLNSDVLVVQGDNSITSFNNTGTFNKKVGGGTSNWSLSFGGAGPVNIQSGTLNLTGTYTRSISGAIAISTGAALNYGQGGTFAGTAVTGTGKLNFTATTAVSGAYSFAGTTIISNGVVTFQKPTSIALLNQTGGTLGGAGPVSVTGTMNWTGGSITGVLNIPAAAVLNMVTPNGVPSQFNLNGGVINNSGTVNHSWVGAGYGLYIYNGASINNLTGGVWNLTSDVLVVQGDNTVTSFNNTGAFNKKAGGGTTNWSLSFGGTGPVNLLSGTLNLSGTYTRSISGSIAISTGAGLTYGQGGTFAGTQVTGTGTLNFAATTTVSGAYTFAGTTIISNGVITFQKPTSIGLLNQTGGTLAGAGPITVTSTMNWTGGSITGVLNVPVKAVLNIVTPNGVPSQFNLNGGVINNSGTVNHSWVGAGYGLYIYNGATINNLLGAVWNLTSDVLVVQGDSTVTSFNNTGTFNKKAGGGTSNWSLSFGGTGPVNLLSGTLNLNNTYTRSIAGPIAISTGAGLNYGQGGTFAGTQVTGTGKLNFTATTTISGAYTFAGTTIISGGVVTFQKPTSIGLLNQTGGTLGGAGPVSVTGTMNWTGGSITGVLNIPVGAVMNIVTPNGVPSQFNLNGGVINNSGTVNHSWVGAGYGLYIYNGASINNLTGATWNLTSDVLVVQGDDSVTSFNNTGTFNKKAGGGTSNWSLAFGSTGPVNILSGSLNLTGTYTRSISGAIAMSTGAGLTYGQGGTFAGTQVTGTGTLNFTATTAISGAYTFAGTTVISNGVITFQKPTSIAILNQTSGTLAGPGPVSVTGTMNWTGGSITGVLNIPAKAVMNVVTPNGVPSQYNINGGVINNSGTVNHSWVGAGYGLYVYNGATINNQAGGIWNLLSDTLVVAGDLSAVTFNNAGTFNKNSGAGTSNWTVIFKNTGTVNVNSGTMSLNGTYPTSQLSGTINLGSPAVLNYSQQGTLTNGKMLGTGKFNLTANNSNGTNTITGTYQLTVPTQVLSGILHVSLAATLNASNLTLTNATLTVDGTTAIGKLNVTATAGNTTGSTVAGAGTINVTDTLTWSQGTASFNGIFNVQNMTLASNSSLSFKLGSSALSVNAKLTLDGTLTLSPVGNNPAVGTTFKVLNFANNYFGNFLNDLLDIPIPGTNDYLKESLTSSGLSFVVTPNPPPAVSKLP